MLRACPSLHDDALVVRYAAKALAPPSAGAASTPSPPASKSPAGSAPAHRRTTSPDFQRTGGAAAPRPRVERPAASSLRSVSTAGGVRGVLASPDGHSTPRRISWAAGTSTMWAAASQFTRGLLHQGEQPGQRRARTLNCKMDSPLCKKDEGKDALGTRASLGSLRDYVGLRKSREQYKKETCTHYTCCAGGEGTESPRAPSRVFPAERPLALPPSQSAAWEAMAGPADARGAALPESAPKGRVVGDGVLTGDADKDDSTRRSHAFEAAPSAAMLKVGTTHPLW